MRIFAIVIITYLFPIITWGQVVCSGTIRDAYNGTIPGASVMFKDENNSIKHYGFSDDQGHFSIPIEGAFNYIVEVNSVGFEKQQKQLHTNSETKNYTLDFTLIEKVEDLQTIVIDVESPIKERGDTLVFDARAFTFGNEKTVEDLLKNIPGIEISKEGKIKFENREIEKVMIEGDDLFNKGYALLTKNMPNEPLDKVEVLQNYSNNKLLKGIENSDAVALNLTIQEGYRDLWFGNINLNVGYIDDWRYDSSANLMNFSKRYKNFLNLSGNNVGIDRIGDLGQMFYNNREIETIGNSGLSTIMYAGVSSAPQLRDYRTRNNNAKHATLSIIVPINEKIKLKTTGFLGFDKQVAFQQNFESFAYNQVAFENNTSRDQQIKFFKGYINLMGTYDINTNNLLQASSVFNKATSDYKSLFVFNDDNTHEALDTRQDFFDQKFTYTHKWKEKNAIVFKNRFFTTQLPQHYTIDDYLFGNLFPNNPDRIENQIKNKKIFFGTEADIYLKQTNDDLINFQVGYQYHKQHLKTHFQLFENNQSFSPNDFQTDTHFALGDLYAKGGYTWSWSKINLRTRAEIHQLINQWNSLNTSEEKYPFYINPSVNTSIKISPTQDFNAGYQYTIHSNDLLQTNDTYLLTSSRSFRKGLGYFEQINQHSINANYQISHYLNRYNLMVVMNYNKQNKDFSTKSTINQNQSLSQTILIKGRESWNGFLKANYYVRPWSSNFRFETNYSYNTFYNEINNNGLRKVNYQNQSYKLEWYTSFTNTFNFHLSTEWNISKTRSETFQSGQTSAFSFFDITCDFHNQISGKISTEHYYFGGLPSDQRNHLFLDLEATYRFKDSEWEISLTAKNLLNKKTFSTRYVSDTGYSENTYQLMKRYILIGTRYRFNLR